MFHNTVLLCGILLNIVSAHQPPNIIIFVADDLGFGDVGYNGATDVATPNIDALASNGVILNNYYVAPVCTPSRGALLSGLLPIHTGTQHYVILTNEPHGFPLDVPLLPQYLKKYSYSNHAVGKWHLGFYKSVFTPTFRGFDSHVGYWSGAQDYFDHSTLEGINWGFDFRHNLTLIKNATGIYSTTYFTQRCLDIINHHHSSNPLFLYVAYQSVHGANKYARLQAPQKYVTKFDHIKDARRRTFAGMLLAMDESIGTVFDALFSRGLLENSIVIFTSDNGGPASGFSGNAASNWPLRGVKATLWEGGVRVPAIVWSPLLQQRTYVSDALMHVTDWLPTILEAVQGDQVQSANIDGYSLWKTLSQNTVSPRKEALLNIDPLWNVSAIRVGDWKLIQGLVFPNWSGWYPPLGKHTIPTLVFNSTIEVVLRKMNMVGKSSRKNRPAPVDCGQKPKNASGICKPDISPCLFNIKKDPCEYHNVASVYPHIAKALWLKIVQYNQTAVPPGNKALDPGASPIFYDYTWTTWGDYNKQPEQCAR